MNGKRVDAHHLHVPMAFGVVLALSAICGCQTLAGKTPPPIEPPVGPFQPTVEHTVGDFTFAMAGADMKPSHLDGKLLSKEIMCAWKERGYIRDAEFVDEGEFSGTADYHLTLSGSQHNDSSFLMELLNALTLMFLPYSVTQEYDLHYVLHDVKTGATYQASVQGADKTQIEIFLLLTFPVNPRGHSVTINRMGAHLYDQFYRQGAFQLAQPVPPASAASNQGDDGDGLVESAPEPAPGAPPVIEPASPMAESRCEECETAYTACNSNCSAGATDCFTTCINEREGCLIRCH